MRAGEGAGLTRLMEVAGITGLNKEAKGSHGE